MTIREAGASERGVTLIEATIILAVISILSSVLMPEVTGYVERARQAKAREDVQVVADAINSFITDTGELQFLLDGSNGASDQTPPTRLDANRVNLLVSDGDIPSLSTNAAVSTSTLWTQVVNGGTADTLENHLIENVRMTAGVEPKVTTKRYRNPTDINVGGGANNIDFARTDSAGFNAPYAWRGAYLRGPVGPDPWGNRYAVNVVFLDPSPTAALASGLSPSVGLADYARMDVFVLSAGPDENIDTPAALDGAVPGNDDYIRVVSSNAK